MNGSCTNCDRRHKAAQQGFCEEFTVQPQISLCPAFLAAKPNHSQPVVPARPTPANEPTGEYIHLRKDAVEVEMRQVG